MKKKATSDKKIQRILPSLTLNDVKIYLRDGAFTFDVGIVNLHPTKELHCVAYKIKNYFDLYGCSPPQNLSRVFINQNGYCFYSEYKVPGQEYYCASFCLYTIYLTKTVGIGF